MREGVRLMGKHVHITTFVFKPSCREEGVSPRARERKEGGDAGVINYSKCSV